MQKNVASQKLIVFAFDSATNLPKTGDSANITAYVAKDFGTVTVLGDTTATEMDATNAKGYYLFDLTQSETNADILMFSAKSSTSGVVVVGAPAVVATIPANFSGLTVTSGVVDSNVKQIAGTQSAADGLNRSTKGIATGTVGSASTTTSIVTSSLSPAAAVTDQFKGRIVTFASDTTTANLRGQSTDITGSSSGGVLTVTALTTAPASGDTFSIT